MGIQYDGSEPYLISWYIIISTWISTAEMLNLQTIDWKKTIIGSDIPQPGYLV